MIKRRLAIWFTAAVLFAAIMGTILHSQIVTGQFPTSGPSATLVLVNVSSLSDEVLANVSVSLAQRFGNVAVALRVSGQTCQPGEWCLLITDGMIGRAPNPGAVVGQEVTLTIVRRLIG